MGNINSVFVVHGIPGIAAAAALLLSRGRFLLPGIRPPNTLATDAFALSVGNIGLLGLLVWRQPNSAAKRSVAQSFLIYHLSVVAGAIHQVSAARKVQYSTILQPCDLYTTLSDSWLNSCRAIDCHKIALFLCPMQAKRRSRNAPTSDQKEEAAAADNLQAGLGSVVVHGAVAAWFAVWLRHAAAPPDGIK